MSLEPVEKVVGYKLDDNGEHFQIQWSKNDITWEPLANLSCPGLLKEFVESIIELKRKKKNASKPPVKKVEDDGLRFKKIKKDPGAATPSRYSGYNAFTNAAPSDKPTSLREMFTKNNRYSVESYRPQQPQPTHYDYNNRRNYYQNTQYENYDNYENYDYNYQSRQPHPHNSHTSYSPYQQHQPYTSPYTPHVQYPPKTPQHYPEQYHQAPVVEEENDEFHNIPEEQYQPKMGVHTELIVNKFDLGEIRFAWLTGSLNDDHTLPPAIYLTKVIDWSKVFVLLMGFYMDTTNFPLDIFSVAPANNHEAFSELLSTLNRCEKVAVDWASSGHVFLVFPLFEGLKKKFGLTVTETSSMICLKIPADRVELGNLNSIDAISSLLGETEKSITWLTGSARYQQELENLCLLDISQVDLTPGSITFAVFGPEDCYELQEACKQLISMKATYSNSLFIRSVNVVLIAKSYLQFLHSIPNFIQLKWRKVQFFVLGRKVQIGHPFRLSFKNILPKGGVITVTSRFLLDAGLESFSTLIKWTQNPRSDWLIRIPTTLYDDFSRFIVQFMNSVSYQGFLLIQQALQSCIENFQVLVNCSIYRKGVGDYMHQLEYKYSLTHRHFIIIDKEPFTFLDSSSVQVLTAGKVVELLRTQSQLY